MEFDIDVNSLLREVITKIDSRLQVCRHATTRYPDARMQLFDIVNKMGEASARAQGLAGAITTGRRLETSDHHLYVMKDPEGSRGKGVVIGILKMGRKRLFVYDRHGQQWEMNPMCVLDFYVHESRQRMGCGRRLFDFMLSTEKLAPQHLAVDRPSHKFSSFLAKHYGLKAEIPQVNNFVIFEGFFTKRSEGDFVNNRRNVNQARPADNPKQGYIDMPTSWPKSNNYNNTTNTVNTVNTITTTATPNNKLHPYHRNHSSLANNNSRPPSGPHTRMAMAPAGLPSVLPRHQTSYHQDAPLRELNLNPRSAQPMNHSGNTSPRGLSDLELRSLSAGSGHNNLQLQSSMYSRHQAPPNPAPPQPHYTTTTPHHHQPPPPHPTASNSGSNVHGGNGDGIGGGVGVGGVGGGGGGVVASNLRQRPPSGSRMNGLAKREKTPPLLQREGGAPRDYQDSFNLHQNYQGRAGHLVLPPDPRGERSSEPKLAGSASSSSASRPPSGVPNLNTGNSKAALDNGRSAYSHRGGYYTNPALHTTSDTSWTVFGVLRNQNHFSARHAGRTRLW